MISAGDFRNGITLEIDWTGCSDLEFQHVKPGKGAAFVRTKYKRIMNGGIREESFNPTAKFETAYIERKEVQYLYDDGEAYNFMDQETFDQFAMPHEEVEDRRKFVKEEMTVKIMSYKGKIFDLEPPLFVELEVTETEPGFKGNTSTGATKPCTVETGAQINVPLFVEIGDKIQIAYKNRRISEESLIYANNKSKPMPACGFDVVKRQWCLFCNDRNGVQTISR